jgi:hypothetical protein
MKNKIIFIYLLALIFLVSENSFSQTKKIIIKLKKNTPINVLNSFQTGNVKSGNTSLSKLCKDLNITDSKSLFVNLKAKFKEEEISAFNFDKIFICDLSAQDEIQALNILRKNEYVEYVQKNNRYNLNAISPNDPYYSSQYYLSKVNAPSVWSVTQGDSTIIIGVIDSGLDFLHQDLQGSYKINWGEIPNNNIDDDNNGYIDDFLGWNFVSNNNNPSDDNIFSHGTEVAGLMTAVSNNGIGIASVAPGCKVLVLKAFDSQGIGYDNDVSSAILYAISRGVKIINMSFGDYVYSYLLQDIIRFAYSKNIVMTASAGNDNSDVLHYPSAFDEVISVGASDMNDNKASFSAFGETVDLFAPGYQILSTSRTGMGSSEFNNDYAYINGTSFSAPIVSGAAALLLSKNRNLTNEEIRGILVSSTDYFPSQIYWSHLHSSGRLNIANAISYYGTPSVARIYFPYQDFSDTLDALPIVVSAASPLFQSYSVYYGIGENPFEFIPIVSGKTSQVLKDTACIWNLSLLPDTSITLRLAINSNNGRTIEHRLIFYKGKDKPVFTGYSFGEIIEKNYFAELIIFTTKSKTLGKIFYKRKNIPEAYTYIFADGNANNTGTISDVHYGLLREKDLIQNSEYEFYLEAQSLNGQTSILQDTSFHFTVKPVINNYGYVKKEYKLPFFQTCNTLLDITNTGRKDLFVNDIDSNLKLKIFQFTGNTFIRVPNYSLSDFSVARDLTYLSGNNRVSLLTSTSRNGAVYEASAQSQYPSVKIWSDEGSDNFWSSRFADINGNGSREILGFGKTGLRILEYNGSSFSETALLPYSKTGAQANSQNTLVDDFDGDGKNEVIFVDTYFPNTGSSNQNTGINIYKNTSANNYSLVFKDSLERFIKGDNVICGDFDGDGKKEFAFGTISNTSDLIQYYSLYVYKYLSGQYRIIDIIDIYYTDANAEVSTKAGNTDGDNKDEILINTGKNFYIIKYNSASGKFEPVLFLPGINTVNQLVYDFDGNGINEIGINSTSDTLNFYEKDIPFGGPQTPLSFNAFSSDSNRVNLNFTEVSGAEYYKIYRTDNDTLMNFALYDSTTVNNYSDLNVINRKNYLYKITAVDTSLQVRESKPTNYRKVYVHNKSRLLNAVSEGNGFVTLTFSELINVMVPVPAVFTAGALGSPKLVSFKSGKKYLLSFENRIPNGIYGIKANGLKDFYGSQVDSNSIVFTVNQTDSVSFYIKNVSLTDKYRLRVEFNLNADTVTSRNPDNYSFEPFNFKINSVEQDNNRSIVYLNLSSGSYIGASGKNYLLKAFNIYSSNGIKITDGAGGSFGLIFNKENLNDVFVFPNPHTKNSKNDYITFANLTRTAKIYIYDLTGKFINAIEAVNGNGGADWNLKFKDGREVPTGIYIFRAEGKDSNGKEVDEKTGKFMVIR